MQTRIQMVMDKETDNKYRWHAVLDGDIEFKLYIPKWRCPRVPPREIMVGIMGGSPSAQENGWDVRAEVIRFEDHTETVRYRPQGDPEDWEIGEPYVPYCALPDPCPDRITIGVSWG